MTSILKAALLGAIALVPQFAAAEDAALIVVGNDYRRLPDVPGAPQAAALAQALEAEGFRVTSSLDQDAEEAWKAVAEFRDDAAGADRVFVLLAGHMVSTAREGWLLTRYADDPTDLNVGGEAVPLGPILDVAALHPGQAVVMLAGSGGDVSGPGLTAGVHPVAPQGVTVLQGPLAGLVRVANEVLLVPGTAPASALANPPRDVVVSGFVSDALPFLPALGGAAVPTPTPAPAPTPAPQPDTETAYWQVALRMDSVMAYQSYLDAYPRGRYANDARAAIARIEGSAETRAQAAEDALGLTRDARREIQRNLSLLGYDPRGIDGIFGPGSRAAIAAWQTAGGYPANGYLTRDQIGALGDAASVRAAQLEAEAAARQAEQERLDTIYWRETGRNGDESGLRAYLERYPDGLFADVAEARLEEYEAAKRAAAQAQDRAYWDETRASDTPTAYRDYLQRYPNGAFTEEANARLEELTGPDDDALIAAAQAEEARVAGNGVTRLLVETRLKVSGFDPGRVDGSFDKEARRAIRRFQRSHDLPVTGYVTQATMVRLLAPR